MFDEQNNNPQPMEATTAPATETPAQAETTSHANATPENVPALTSTPASEPTTTAGPTEPLAQSPAVTNQQESASAPIAQGQPIQAQPQEQEQKPPTNKQDGAPQETPQMPVPAEGQGQGQHLPDETAIAPEAAVVTPDPAITGMTTVSSPVLAPPNVTGSVLISKAIPVEQTSEQIVAQGGTEFQLQNKPLRIDSVILNGQLLNVVEAGNALAQAAHQVIYDAEKGALVFASDVQGLIQVAYRYVPEVEHGLLPEIMAWLHERVTAIEAAFEKMRGANFV